MRHQGTKSLPSLSTFFLVSQPRSRRASITTKPSTQRQTADITAKTDQLPDSEEPFSTGPGHAYPHYLTNHVDATSCLVSNLYLLPNRRPSDCRFIELRALTVIVFRSLYRRSLKLALDWAVHRHLWRGQAMYIRSLFEANRNVTDPRHQRALLTETEKLLESWKHPDPYTPPTAPGGSKFERNLPSPVLDPPPHPVNRH
ncbi:NADH dehydrogenase (ubiquinone) 1 beta subcomplex 9 [Fusarium sp. NRRL 52700]|nr:NADH dehydrogenase (ubiquinone) 1 beta subcomplex 9 [Fusarium sp. NRRL 52700]